MATKILVQPAEDYFVAFLSTRGINITSEDVEVIHYFGSSKSKIKKLFARHDPDLILIHNKKAFDLDYKFPYVLDEIKCDRDIYQPRRISTNCPELARLHYQSLGLERILYDTKE